MRVSGAAGERAADSEHQNRSAGRMLVGVVVGWMLMLAGCVGGAPAEPVIPSSLPPIAVSASPNGRGAGTVTAVEGNHSPGWVRAMEWRPQVPVGDLRQFTEEEKLELWDEHVAEIARRYRLQDPPEVGLERWIRVDETGPVLGKCLSEFGYEMTYDPFPGISGGPGTQNGGDFALADQRVDWFICESRFAIDPTYMQPPTRDQARVQYEYWNEVWLPCVRGMGYELVDPPDLETFVQEYVAHGGWSPWSDANIGMEADLQCGPVAPAVAAYYGH